MALPDNYGPPYPELGVGVAKLRRNLNGCRKAHGNAVLAAFRSLHRASLRREMPTHAPACASGTGHTTGKAILKAVAASHRAALAAYPAQERKRRKPDVWIAMYEAAMADKRQQEKRDEA